MDLATRAAYDATRRFERKAFRAACYAPFSSLYFVPSGDVSACCKSGTFVLGNMAREGLDDVWNGPRIRAMRNALRRYALPRGCEFCEWQIAGGNYQLAHTRVFERLPVEDDACTWPVQMEFALSNLCNYECIMCSGFLSSRIRANREGLPPLPKAYGERFFKDLRKYLPHLHWARWFGGEPLLAPENYRIWDMMIADGTHPDLRVQITTNASTYNAKVERVMDALPVDFAISIDGISKATLETIRIGAKQEEVLENVRRFHQYTRKRGTELAFAFCLMRQNWHEFGEFLLYAEDLGCPVWLNTVIEPDHCSLYTLPTAELQQIAAQLARQGDSVADRLRINRTLWTETVQDLERRASTPQAEAVQHVRDAWISGGDRIDHIGAGWKHVGQGQFDAALKCAQQVPRTDPGYYFALQLAAHAQRRCGDHAAAERTLDEAIALAKRVPEAWVERAWLRHDQGRFHDGIADAEFALSLHPPRPLSRAAIWDALGFLWRAVGNHEKSIEAFDRLLELRPDDPKVRVHRAWAFRKAGRREAARSEAEAALALDPADEEARRLASELVG